MTETTEVAADLITTDNWSEATFAFTQEATGNGDESAREARLRAARIGSRRDTRLDWDLLAKVGESDWEPEEANE